MDKRKEAFLTRLRETFRIEAAEHVTAIVDGLVTLEHTQEPELRVPLIEKIFREAHSLKGAARSVSLREVESLCVELENLFSSMKRNELVLSTTLLDRIHPALDLISKWCAVPAELPSPEDLEKEKQIIASLQNVSLETAPADPKPVEIPFALPTSSVALALGLSTPPSPPQPPKPIPVTKSAAQEVVPAHVRIATQKLDAILLATEELVGLKIAVSGHAAELHRLAIDLGHENHRRVQQLNRIRQSREYTGVVREWIESETSSTKTLEETLRTLTNAVRQDARALNLLVDNVLENAKKALLLPCSYLLNLFPKSVRDLARDQGKEVELVLRGEDIEIDRRVLDELKDPLLHLLRNAVDHGIEKPPIRVSRGKTSHGLITIAVAAVQGNRFELMISDDGTGIDATQVKSSALRLGIVESIAHLSDGEAIDFIFHSGLSTSPLITDLSGRGLGLAIVREKVEQLGGTVSVCSTPGSGTTFRMLVPLSRATFRGVFVGVVGQRFAIPSANVNRVMRISPEQIKTVENRQTIAVEGRAVALARLRDVLSLSGAELGFKNAVWPVVIVRAQDQEIALVVDEVFGEQEMMVKGLGPQLPRVRNLAGASISPSGAVIPVLHALDLIGSAGFAGKPTFGSSVQKKKHLLIAEDSITARTLLKTILESAGYQVTASVDGLDALTRLKASSFDLVVSDVDMPKMNGFELTARIRADEKLKGLPVVLVTALGSQKDREYGIEVGANAYLIKSDFDQGNLISIIQRLL
ncbi:Hybrid sensor histidine kinase/response regulator [Gammaproteobacteria bacterium]